MTMKVLSLILLGGLTFGLHASAALSSPSSVRSQFDELARLSADIRWMNNQFDSYVRNPITDRTTLAWKLNYKAERLRDMQRTLDVLEASRNLLTPTQQAELNRIQENFRALAVYHGHAAVIAMTNAPSVSRFNLEKKASSMREHLREIVQAARNARGAA